MNTSIISTNTKETGSIIYVYLHRTFIVTAFDVNMLPTLKAVQYTSSLLSAADVTYRSVPLVITGSVLESDVIVSLVCSVARTYHTIVAPG